MMISLQSGTDRGENPTQDRPCGASYSPEEAFTAVRDTFEPVTRDGWWRHRWRSTLREPTPRFDEVARQENTSGVMLVRYLQVLSGFSDKTGETVVFATRPLLAERMRCSVSVVAKCRRAAIKLGYHTAGRQLRWINEEKPGEDPWCGGPAMLRLVMPDKATLGVSEKATQVAERVHARRQARHRAAMERKEAENRRRRETAEALADPTRVAAPQPRAIPSKARAALETARAELPQLE